MSSSEASSFVTNFEQSSNGFGFSNFRTQAPIPPSIGRNTSDFQLEDTAQYTNPIANYEYHRHSNFLFNDHYGDYKIIDQKQESPDYIYLDIIKNVQERNPLIDFYFSKRNLDHVQNLIISMIHAKTQGAYKISRQSDNELLTIMRSIYITTPTNPFATGRDFRAEVCKLNKNVLDWVIPRLLVNIQQYLGYVRDQGNNVYPIEHPQFLSSAGNRINRGFDVNFI